MCMCVILILFVSVEEGGHLYLWKVRELAGVRRSKACACDKTMYWVERCWLSYSHTRTHQVHLWDYIHSKSDITMK